MKGKVKNPSVLNSRNNSPLQKRRSSYPEYLGQDTTSTPTQTKAEPKVKRVLPLFTVNLGQSFMDFADTEKHEDPHKLM